MQGGNEVWIHKWYANQDLLGLAAMKPNPSAITQLWDSSYAPEGLPWDQQGAKVSWYGLNAEGNTVYASLPSISAEKAAQAQAIFDATWKPSIWVTRASNFRLGYNTAHAPYGGGAGTYVEGLLSLDKRESAEHFLDASLNITGKLALAGKPEATASVLFDRNAHNAATASVMLAYNGRLLDIDISKVAGSNGTGILEVGSSDGVKLNVNVVEGVASGSVKVSGVQVGTISNGILRYNDGTFEALN